MESEGEEELCGSRSARDGGCTFCVLPFGHAGAHDLGRAKRVSKPPAKLKKMKTKELIDEATYATMCKAALDADHAAFLKTLGA